MDRGRQHTALIRTGTSLRITTVPTPSPPEGGVLIAPSFVGICGTDLQILNGTRPDTAEILGHEGAGVVVEAGPGTSIRPGQHVAFNPSAQLPQGKIVGHNVPGLYQQYFPVDAQGVEDGLIQPVENDFPPVCGALVEPVAGVVYTHELISQVVSDLQAAVIFGAGPFGLMMATYLRERGARVLLIHSSQGRLNTARELGLLDQVTAMILSKDSTEQILAWNGGRLLDAAVISTSMVGAPTALNHAVEVVRDGGCIEMVANYAASAPTPAGISAAALRTVRAANICGVPSGGEYVFAEMSGRRIAFTSHRGTSRNHLRRAMQVLGESSERYAALITHVFSLEEASEAITTLSCSRGASIDGRDCIKGVVALKSATGSAH